MFQANKMFQMSISNAEKILFSDKEREIFYLFVEALKIAGLDTTVTLSWRAEFPSHRRYYDFNSRDKATIEKIHSILERMLTMADQNIAKNLSPVIQEEENAITVFHTAVAFRDVAGKSCVDLNFPPHVLIPEALEALGTNGPTATSVPPPPLSVTASPFRNPR